MLPELDALLTHLSAVIDPVLESKIDELYQNSLSYAPVRRLPVAMQYPYPDDLDFTPYEHHAAINDPEKMLFNELTCAFGMSITNREVVGDDLPCTVRANFGTVVVASLFGARIEQVDDNPPWVRHFDTRSEFSRIFEVDVSDVSRGWLPRLSETYEVYGEILSRYPELQSTIKMVLPDLQGPLDNLDLIRGSEVYSDLYEDPGMVAEALDLMAAAQVALAEYFSRYVNDGPAGFTHQHGVMNRGAILIRNDSSIMVSPGMYREQIAPFDAKIFAELGGGGMHSCGRFQHLVDEYLDLESIQAIDFGQSDLNDVDEIYSRAATRRIPLLRIFVTADELASGSILKKYPTGISLIHQAASAKEAARTMAAYRTVSGE